MVCRVTHDAAPADASPAETAVVAAETASAQQAERPLTFGLVGTGHWARFAHAPALASAPEIKFGAVWGRNTEAAARMAAEFGVTAHVNFDLFLTEVDAVAFSVPPDVQSELAVIAARERKHMLLEKPVALTETAADAMVRAVDEAAVASVVFFTARFQPDARAWLADVVADGGWQGGRALWLGSSLAESSPFNSPWRRAKGALWDLGPHVLSLLWPILGPVETVTADAGRGDLAHLVLHHQGGATSTATVTQGAPEAADGFDLQVWGTRGRSAVPQLAADPLPALQAALTDLVATARSGDRRHPCDVRFGRDVTRVLAQAERHLDAARRSGIPA
jgi:predicted dehydrogenase